MATEVVRYVDPDATGAGNGTSWTDAYTSLAALITAEKKNLTSADEYYTIYCRSSGGTPDYNNASFVQADWTCDATHTITVIGADFPSDGIWDSSAYVLYNNSVGTALSIGTPYTTIRNLQVYATQNGSPNYIYGVTIGNTTGVVIDSCIIQGDPNSVDPWYFFGLAISNGANVDVINTIVYGWDSQAGGTAGIGIDVSGPTSVVNLYNCTVYNCQDYGIRRYSSGTLNVYNCAVGDCGDDFNGTIATIQNCCSDDGDGSNAQNPSGGDWDNEFTDKDNGDFSLLAGGNCVGNGTDDPGSGLYSDDITGGGRTSPWDIGAFEYGASSSSSSLSSSSSTSSSSSVSSSSSSSPSSSSSFVPPALPTLSKGVEFATEEMPAADDIAMPLGNGRLKVRPRYTRRPHRWRVSWRLLTAADYLALETFYLVTCRRSKYTFEFTEQGVAQTWLVRFDPDDPPQWQTMAAQPDKFACEVTLAEETVGTYGPGGYGAQYYDA